MTKKALTQEQKVFKELAATGRYVSTGKVLIGLTHIPKPPEMTQNEELMQNILLGNYRRLVSDQVIVYVAFVLVVLTSLFVSCSK